MKTLLLALLASSLSGCVYTSVTTKGGSKLTRVSVFGNQQAQRIDLDNGTMDGYASDQAQAAALTAGAVAKALARP